MTFNVEATRVEVTTDPLGRGYNGVGSENAGPGAMTDAEVVTSLNAVNRDGRVPIQEIMDFLHYEIHSTDGTDTQDRSIWTRMNDVSALAETPTGAVANPWGSTAIGTVTEIQQIKTKQLLRLFNHSVQGNLDVDLSDANFAIFLAGAEAAGCMSTAQETSINALPNNRQSRADEQGLGNPSESDIAFVRAL